MTRPMRVMVLCDAGEQVVIDERLRVIVDGEITWVTKVADLGPAAIHDLAIVHESAAGWMTAARLRLQMPGLPVIEFPQVADDVVVARLIAELGRVSQTAMGDVLGGVEGHVVAVAAPKGGTGATNSVVQVGIVAAKRGHRVCIVDLGAAPSNVAMLFGLDPFDDSRGLSALLGVPDADLTWANFRLALSAVNIQGRKRGVAEIGDRPSPDHLHLLLNVSTPEQRAAIPPAKALMIVRRLQELFDVVLVDCGSRHDAVSDALVKSAVESVVVVTPDHLAVSAASRLLERWRDSGIRPSTVVVNRWSRDSHLQRDSVYKLLGHHDADPQAVVYVPARFGKLERHNNSGTPYLVDDSKLRRAFEDVADACGIAKSPPTRRGDTGQVAIEVLGVFPILVLIALVVWQVALVGYTFVLAGHAASEAARQVEVRGDPSSAAMDDLPDAWRDGARVAVEDDAVVVTVAVPVIMPGLDSPRTISARAGAAGP